MLPIIGELTPIILNYALNSVRALLVDAASGLLPAATTQATRIWAMQGLDLALRAITGRAADYWSSHDPSGLSAAFQAAEADRPGAMLSALSALQSEPSFVALLLAHLKEVAEEAEPRNQSLYQDAVVAMIPSTQTILEWAEGVANKYQMSPFDIIAMRAAALTPGRG